MRSVPLVAEKGLLCCTGRVESSPPSRHQKLLFSIRSLPPSSCSSRCFSTDWPDKVGLRTGSKGCRKTPEDRSKDSVRTRSPVPPFSHERYKIYRVMREECSTLVEKRFSVIFLIGSKGQKVELWCPKIELWLAVFRTIPPSVLCYHNAIKNQRNPGQYFHFDSAVSLPF